MNQLISALLDDSLFDNAKTMLWQKKILPAPSANLICSTMILIKN